METDIKLDYIDRKVDYHYWNKIIILLDGLEIPTNYVIAARSGSRGRKGWIQRYREPLRQGIDGLPEKEKLYGQVIIMTTRETDS